MPTLRRSTRLKNSEDDSENEIPRRLRTPDIFLVPEILEAILLRLDMHTLLISARDSTRVGDMVRGTAPLLHRRREKGHTCAPEASWRRMLLQQPPTSIVRFWNPECLWGPYWHDLPKDQMVKTGAEWTPEGDYLRMENVAYEVDTGAISAGPCLSYAGQMPRP
ncbi:uncharacterized protein BO95DRAFT_460632 [Aspergillus brunneoviolaceus CBS 621.78]|uniref:Uncharacterized protein n=1 Tax=Aspergillus brunneoviolaceus CBS 621.78 TaxID=1450534 RepID=A0ACD1GHX1_9EURO|nr:hypothetical protein BO95DRAFT_460632 [Aspergillus brunneoviolaceus CBS 621.78]RAH48772.1 hypothetical protein BO95DRAFT_460632 [Aspergillus brunneoviolaceus CBS 621.78]